MMIVRYMVQAQYYLLLSLFQQPICHLLMLVVHVPGAAAGSLSSSLNHDQQQPQSHNHHASSLQRIMELDFMEAAATEQQQQEQHVVMEQENNDDEMDPFFNDDDDNNKLQEEKEFLDYTSSRSSKSNADLPELDMDNLDKDLQMELQRELLRIAVPVHVHEQHAEEEEDRNRDRNLGQNNNNYNNNYNGNYNNNNNNGNYNNNKNGNNNNRNNGNGNNNNNNYNKNGNNYYYSPYASSSEDYTNVDMTNYALKYVGCQNIHTWSDEKATSEYSMTPLKMDRFVILRLCEANSCSTYNKWGCNSNFGQYILPMEDYLSLMAKYHFQQYSRYCTTCAACMNFNYNKFYGIETDDHAEEEDGGNTDDAKIKQYSSYAANSNYAYNVAASYGDYDDEYDNGHNRDRTVRRQRHRRTQNYGYNYNNNNNNGGNNNNNNNGYNNNNYNNNRNGNGNNNNNNNRNGNGNNNNNNYNNNKYGNNNNNNGYQNYNSNKYNNNGNSNNNNNNGNSNNNWYSKYGNNNNNNNKYSNNNSNKYSSNSNNGSNNGGSSSSSTSNSNNYNSGSSSSSNSNNYNSGSSSSSSSSSSSNSGSSSSTSNYGYNNAYNNNYKYQQLPWYVDQYGQCMFQTVCSNYNHACKSYRPNTTYYEAYFSCTSFQLGNKISYLGPHCRQDGHTIGIGIYQDYQCSTYIGDVVDIEATTNMRFDDKELSLYYDKSCISCSAKDEYSLITDTKLQQNYTTYTYPVCEALYDNSAKCNRYLGSKSFIKSSQSSQQSANEEKVCKFMEALVLNEYDESGEIVVREDFDPTNWKSRQEYVKLARKATPSQMVGLLLSMSTMFGLLAYACYLHKKLLFRTPWRPPRSVTEPLSGGAGPYAMHKDAYSSAGRISRLHSGIVASRSRSADGGSSLAATATRGDMSSLSPSHGGAYA